MPDPLAYFLTWRTYGTWLHGDDRGSVDKDHCIPGTPYVEPDAAREYQSRRRMTGPPYLLSPSGRILVEEVIRKHCEIRNWFLHAVNPRTTHVHVVVDCRGPKLVTPDIATDQFKAWATRRLRETDHAHQDQEVWAERGSKRWIDTPASLAKAIDYVLNQQ